MHYSNWQFLVAFWEYFCQFRQIGNILAVAKIFQICEKLQFLAIKTKHFFNYGKCEICVWKFPASQLSLSLMNQSLSFMKYSWKLDSYFAPRRQFTTFSEIFEKSSLEFLLLEIPLLRLITDGLCLQDWEIGRLSIQKSKS